jgi:hypothetical protein
MGAFALDLKLKDISINVSKWPDGLYLMALLVDDEKKLTNRFVIRY